MAAAVSLVTVAGATDYVWTGNARNGKWTDAANWSPEGVPGCWIDGSAVVYGGDSVDKATFGADASGADAVTIDLAGQKYVKDVVIAKGAPAYTFGTSAEVAQSLGINTNGTITVDAGVEHDQRFPWIRLNANGTTSFINNSRSAVFRFAQIDSIRRNGDLSVGGSPYGKLWLKGAGDFEAIGGCKFDQCGEFHVSTTGKLTLDDQSTIGPRYSAFFFDAANGAVHEVELPTVTSRIRGNGGTFPWSETIQFQENTHVYGPGAIAIPIPYNIPVEMPNQPARLRLSGNKTATIDCAIVPHPNFTAVRDLALFASGDNGVFNLNGTNTLAGSLRILGEHTVVGARLLGNKGCSVAETSVPLGDTIVFESNWNGGTKMVDSVRHIDTITPTSRPGGTLKFTGAADSATDRTLMVSNIYASVNAALLPTNTFANAGAGTFTLNSEIVQSPESRGASFRLKAETARLVFAGRFVGDETHFWNLLVDGPETVAVTRAQDYTGFTSIDGGTLEIASLDTLPNTSGYLLNGGTLRLTTAAGSVSKPISVIKSGSAIVLPENAGTVVLGITCAAGVGVAFTIPEGTVLKVLDFAEGPLNPTLFSVNGYSGRVEEDGTIVADFSRWALAQNGDWNESGKWTPAPPTAFATAVIDVESEGGYTVSVTDGSADGVKDIRVANGATLCFDTDYRLWGQHLEVGSNGTVVAGRRFAVEEHDEGGLELKEGGAFRIEPNATSVVSGATAAYIDQRGGTYDIAGRLVFADAFLGNTFYLRDGGAVVRDGGVLGDGYNGNASIIVAPNEAGGTAELTIEAGGKFAANQGSFKVGGTDGGRSVVNIAGGSSSTLVYESKNIYGLAVGYQHGLGELNFTGGRLDVGNNGFFVGSFGISYGDTSSIKGWSCPTGVVNVTGGELTVNGFGWHYSAGVCGLLVGSGLMLPSDSNLRPKCSAVGELNVTGGSLTTAVGPTIVGGGRAEGEMNISGGSFYQNGYNTYESSVCRCPLVVGMEGGSGRMNVTGGSAKVKYLTFVGGAKKKELQHTSISATYYAVVPEAATGVLSVKGGRFTTDAATGDVIVGSDGAGTVEIGGTGVFGCRNLVLSNNVSSVLRFDLPAKRSDIAWQASCTNLVITSGAKLVIDVSEFTGMSCSLAKLLAVDEEIEGEFGADQVEFLYAPDQQHIFWNAQILTEVDGKRGLWLKCEPTGMIMYIQ